MALRNKRKKIYVYADWIELNGPQLMGVLSIDRVRGEEVFSFSYHESWMNGGWVQSLDPDLQFFSGDQYLAEGKKNFGLFMDSCPDRWGRLLMQRREAIFARKEGRIPHTLHESDYLLGVFDGNRMGALRFKLDLEGEFLDHQTEFATPPWAGLRELEQASLQLEDENSEHSADYLKWLNWLISPGSSLGGARPKANVVDEEKQLWIAKFPSKHDDLNVGAWELVAHKIALESGVTMSECRVQKFNRNHYTFLTKRFDRSHESRIHFASAMTCLGRVDGDDHAVGVSYLDLAEFLIRNGSSVDEDLEQLWRRIILNICISNCDDHLRNHGFLLTPEGWRLSPAYDLNPSPDGEGLKLNISEHDHSQDLDLALSVIEYFRIDENSAKNIIQQVKSATAKWRIHADELGISKQKQERMKKAFRKAEFKTSED